jgi:hypothetical protein
MRGSRGRREKWRFDEQATRIGTKAVDNVQLSLYPFTPPP